jgi:hypothetical protein
MDNGEIPEKVNVDEVKEGSVNNVEHAGSGAPKL